MAQTGFTPLLIYSSSTGGNAPTAGNLLNNATGSELAINIADGKLFYKDSGNSVQVIAWKTTPITAGGTGLTSYTAGDLPYYASGTAFTKLGIGTSGYFLTSSGTAPQWTDPTTLAVTSISFGTTGLTPSTATKGAVTVAGTLATGNGGTGLTGFTAANNAIYSTSSSVLTAGTLPVAAGGTGLTSLTTSYIPYGNGSSAFSSSSTLTYNGTTLTAGNFIPSSSTIPTNGLFLPTTNTLGFATNSAEAMRIFSSSGVSIGNATDPGATNLYVTGKIGVGVSPSYKLHVQQNATISTSSLPSSTFSQFLDTSGNSASSSLGFHATSANGSQTYAAITCAPGGNDYRSALTATYTADQYGAGYFAINRYAATGSTSEVLRTDLNSYLLIGYTSSNGAYSLQVNSQIYATSSTIATSDKKYKTNVQNITNALPLVCALEPKSFEWVTGEQADGIPNPNYGTEKDIVYTTKVVDENGNDVYSEHKVTPDKKWLREPHNFPSGTMIGFIAQDVQSVLQQTPYVNNVVKQNTREAIYDKDGNEIAPESTFLGIAEGNLISLLTQAIKELNDKFDAYVASHP